MIISFGNEVFCSMIRAIPPSSPSPRLGGLREKPSSSGPILPGLGVGPTKKGWHEGQFRQSSSPRRDDVMCDVSAQFQIFFTVARAMHAPTVKKI